MIGDGEGHADDAGGDDIQANQVVVGSKKISMTRAKVNMLAFEDIFQVGEDKMKKKDYKVSCFQRQKRKERKLKIGKLIYEEVSNDNLRSPTVKEFIRRAKLIQEKS
eukprot:904607-Ditylum_brightwellii.AAC.1